MQKEQTMIEILKSILFGIVEGITEWLPISSTGHMILLNEFVNLQVSAEFYEMYQVVIQLGAIAAVLVLFFHKLNPFSPRKNVTQKKQTWSLWFKVVAAVAPSAVLGVLFDDWMDAHFYNYVVVAITLILYGVAFMLVEKRNAGQTFRVEDVHSIDYKTALLIGAFQCLSLIPGTSRSGSTILGGIMLGVSRGWDTRSCAEFANTVAGLNCTRLGATAGVPDFETALRLARENYR
jgi:undecaprenyl-diphosphatase